MTTSSLKISDLTSRSTIDDGDILLVTDVVAQSSYNLTYLELKDEIKNDITDAINTRLNAAIGSLGAGTGALHFGNFTGARLPSNSNAKQIFQVIEDEIIDVETRVADDEAQLAAVKVSLESVDLNYGNRISALEVAGFISSVPAEYVTETELTAEGFATESFVNTAVAGVSVDLSGYYTKTEIDTAGYLTSTGGATITGDLQVDGKVYYKNVFNTLGDLPSATTYHGMFAHVHSEGAAYYAHGGNWVKLANESSVPTNLVDISDVFIPSVNNGEVLTYNTAQGGWVPQPLPASSTSLTSLTDVTISGTPTTGHVLKWDGSTWSPAADSGGGGGGGIALTDLSVVIGINSGAGNLGYNNVTGVFTFTPADSTLR